MDKYFNNKFTYENNYCKIYDFNINNLDKNDKLNLMELFGR